MPGGDTLAVGSSHSLSGSTQLNIHGCRWAWCRQFFDTNVQLVHHVIHEHVKKSVPVRRREISLLRRLERESMASSDQLTTGIDSVTAANSVNVYGQAPSNSEFQHLESAGTKVGQQSQEHMQELEASVQEPPDPVLEATGLQTPPPVTATAAVRLSPSHGESSAQHPSFASLSSPSQSIRRPSIPPSPAFGLQISRNVSRGLARESDSQARPSHITNDESCHEAQPREQETVVTSDAPTEATGQQNDKSTQDVDMSVVLNPDETMELKTQGSVPQSLYTSQRQTWYQMR